MLPEHILGERAAGERGRQTIGRPGWARRAADRPGRRRQSGGQGRYCLVYRHVKRVGTDTRAGLGDVDQSGIGQSVDSPGSGSFRPAHAQADHQVGVVDFDSRPVPEPAGVDPEVARPGRTGQVRYRAPGDRPRDGTCGQCGGHRLGQPGLADAGVDEDDGPASVGQAPGDRRGELCDEIHVRCRLQLQGPGRRGDLDRQNVSRAGQ